MCSPQKVLIIDDDFILAMVVEIMVNHLGHKVVAYAANRDQALHAVQTHNPDVILMDIQLSDKVDGITLYEEIRQTAHTQVIYITSLVDEANYERAKQIGFVDFLQKPLMVNNLNAAFNKISNIRMAV